MSRCHILYFVKYPEPGKVKTRLAQTIGYEEAAGIYRSLAEENFRTLRELSSFFEICVMFDPPESEARIKEWLTGDSCHYLAQAGTDLGARLAHAFQQAFQGGAKSAIAVGSDTLNLNAGIIHQAAEILKTKDAALGPARDGGYYLIGLSRWEPSVFQNIPWSTEAVAGVTMERIRAGKMSCGRLQELEDLDEAANLKTAFTKPEKPL